MAIDLTMILKIMPYVNELQNLWAVAVSNDDMNTKIKKLAAPVAQLLEEIGRDLFPQVQPQLHALAGFIGSFANNDTKWLQAALNKLLPGWGWTKGKLDEDGYYGVLTREAVSYAQEHLGLTVDGLAGSLTTAALQGELAKIA